MLAKTFVCGMILFVPPTRASMRKFPRFCSTLPSLVIKVSAILEELNLFSILFFLIYFRSARLGKKVHYGQVYVLIV